MTFLLNNIGYYLYGCADSSYSDSVELNLAVSQLHLLWATSTTGSLSMAEASVVFGTVAASAGILIYLWVSSLSW